MNIIRPPGGFKIVVLPEVEKYIQAETRNNFRIEQFWKDILERIKITALNENESHALPSKDCFKFSYTAHGAVDFGIPTIQIIFEAFADTLTIQNALVWTEDDYEDSTYDG